MKNKKAFTLIELLVVIAIIGILATISVLALSNARAKSRDAKRAGDMKQIQTALELFFNDNNRYPTAEEWNTGKIYSTTTGSTSTYMQVIPTAPTPADGNCTSSQNTINYTPTADGSSYSVSFCLGNTTGTLTPGPKCLTPSGVMNSACDISFYPTNLSGLQLWLKADAGVTTDVDGYVSEWNDYSGNNNNANQVTGVSQPLLVEGVLNGKPALRFDGVDDYLNFNTLSLNNFTIYVVFKKNSNNDKMLPLASSVSGDRTGQIYWSDGNLYYNITNDDYRILSSIGAQDVYSIYENIFNGEVSEINSYKNDTLLGNSGGTIGIKIFTINDIGYSNGYNSYANGDIAEIIIYNTVLSDSDRQKVETYLNTKYNLY